MQSDSSCLPRVLEPEVMESADEAWEYDQMDHSEVNRRFVDDLLAAGDVGRDVLDFGTGTALIPIELCQRLPEIRVMAIDASHEMLDLAKRRIDIAQMLGRIQLAQADCKTLEGYQPAMADTVISNSLLHHLPDPQVAIAAAMRVLRPGGRLFIRDLARPQSQETLQQLVDTHADDQSDDAKRLLRESLHAALTVAEAQELFRPYGFSDDCVHQTSDRHWTFDGRKAHSTEST